MRVPDEVEQLHLARKVKERDVTRRGRDRQRLRLVVGPEGQRRDLAGAFALQADAPEHLAHPYVEEDGRSVGEADAEYVDRRGLRDGSDGGRRAGAEQ